ncbi:ABC transporter substrate-binding protein [Cohnella cellulosilytica]|uniref:ABC transporter substrate-binding protein n=1 Tax=Cohnella cellulosilytica TaxID=986710 RepID=A0ABW2F677_9BACL
MLAKTNKAAALALAILLVAALAACGGKSNPEVSSSPAPAAESLSAPPSASSSEPSQETRDDGDTRIVTDEFGEVEVPAHPQRVVGVYVEDYLKALGVTPVAQWYHPLWGKQDYLDLDVPLFDTTGSIEALLSYNPDLIIVDGSVDKEKYETYSKIAPTYRLPESVLQSSPDILKVVADVLNLPEKAEQVIADYESKVADAKAKLESAVGNEKVAVVRVNVGEKTLALFGVKNRYAGVIYTEFGLEPIRMAAEMTDFQSIISEEVIPDLGADHIIFIPSNGSWDTPEYQEDFKLLDSPLWKSVPAFQKGNIYKVERSHWQSGAITANSMKLDDLLRLMVK